MITACKFGGDLSDINERNFPPTGPVADVADMHTVTLSDIGLRRATVTKVRAAIDHLGYRHATLVELLAWTLSMWDGKSTVCASGSIYVDRHGRHHEPVISNYFGGGRGLALCLIPFGEYWCESGLLLIVRK
jgi:hypothetical protein